MTQDNIVKSVEHEEEFAHCGWVVSCTDVLFVPPVDLSGLAIFASSKRYLPNHIISYCVAL